ncbi:MAG: thymidine phosphorylase family protein [Nitrospirota bacterium]
MNAENRPGHRLRLKRLGIDTYQEPVIYMRQDCDVCRSEGFEAQSRVEIRRDGRPVIATLNVVTSDLLARDEAGVSEAAWRLLGAAPGDFVTVRHPPPLESLGSVRAKVHGKRLDPEAITAIVRDIAAGRYADVELAAFLTASAGGGLDVDETVALTRAMIDAGQRIDWGRRPVADKHSVGGIPGNRTSLIVVPIAAACGLIMPKTSSRAITSPSGTADTMETLAPVTLDIAAMRRVVDKEGGCLVWGGSVLLSPADDVLIRVSRPLDLDGEGQLVASILSKKAAAGSTHVVVDLPVGPTAKVRTAEAAYALSEQLTVVGRAVGLHVLVVMTDGSQPVGHGLGPALEARDAVAVLRGAPGAPAALRERGLALAGYVLESAGHAPFGTGYAEARAVLDDGRAWRKFVAICDAQGGMREPPRASHTAVVAARRAGRVAEIDNRRLARVAKLSGAPQARAAGIELHAALGADVAVGQPLLTLHAESPGELAYALGYVQGQPDVLRIEEPA